MKKSSILVALVLASSAFFTLTPANAGGVAETPVWNVGDSWSLGKTIDLSEYGQEIQESIGMMGMSGSVHLSGGMGLYMTMKVVDDDVKIGNTTCYKNSIKGAFGANAKGDISFSMSGFEMQGSMSGWATIVIDLWVDGYIFFTVEKLAIKKLDLTLKVDLKIEGYMDVSSGGMQGGMQQSMEFLFEGSDLKIETTETYAPPLDLFDFPIENGETWKVPKNETEVETSMSAMGSVRIKMEGGGASLDYTEGLSSLIGTVDETTTMDPEIFTLSAEMVGDIFNIKLEGGGMDIGGMTGIPIGEIGMPSCVLIYDPSEEFIDGVSVETEGGLTPLLEPTTEDDVNTFYADPSANVPGPALDLWIILLIIGIIVAVVIVVVAVVAMKKRKKAAMAPAPPGAPGAPVPPEQSIPPQQYPPQQPPPTYGPPRGQ